MNSQEMEKHLEAMIDAESVVHVLVGISLICCEKADLIRASYGYKLPANELAAKSIIAWDQAAKSILSVANKISV